MKPLPAILAAAVLALAAAPASAGDALPDPAIRVVKSGTSTATPARVATSRPAPARVARPVVRNPHRPSSGQTQAAPAPESREAFLARLRAKYRAPTAAATPPPTVSTQVSAPVRTSFPRTASRRNLTIPPAPGGAQPTAPRPVVAKRSVRSSPMPTLRVPAVRRIDPDLSVAVTRPAPRRTRAGTIRSARAPEPRRARTAVTPTARPAPAPRRSPTRIRTAGRKPLTVPATPGAPEPLTAPPRSLLNPPDACEGGG